MGQHRKVRKIKLADGGIALGESSRVSRRLTEAQIIEILSAPIRSEKETGSSAKAGDKPDHGEVHGA
jgi:hypothetical protein